MTEFPTPIPERARSRECFHILKESGVTGRLIAYPIVTH